jgi:hypothetical protein
MAKMYAWSTIYNGGESKEGRDGRKIIMKRNIIEAGSEITKAKLGVSDEEWDALIASGSVRPYAFPKNMNEGESPASAVMRALTRGQGEVSSDMLMELALSHPPEGLLHTASEEAESDVIAGA